MPRARQRQESPATADVGRDGFRAAEPPAADPGFITADDFDATGILAGVDACASSYWWVPEMHTAPEAARPTGAETGAPGQATPGTLPRHQAARRSASRSSTAAA